MVIEIRIYKKYDMDLVALCDAGYPIISMLHDSVVGYANMKPVYYVLDEVIPFDSNDKKTIHTRFNIPDSDVKTCYMLKHIKNRCRNSFCKAVLRNALVQQNICSFFADISLLQLQVNHMKHMNLSAFKNVVYCSKIRAKTKQVTFAGNITSVDNAKPITNFYQQPSINPYVNAPQYYPALQNYIPPEQINPFMEQPSFQQVQQGVNYNPINQNYNTPPEFASMRQQNPLPIYSHPIQNMEQMSTALPNGSSPIANDNNVGVNLNQTEDEHKLFSSDNTEEPVMADNEQLMNAFDAL